MLWQFKKQYLNIFIFFRLFLFCNFCIQRYFLILFNHSQHFYKLSCLRLIVNWKAKEKEVRQRLDLAKVIPPPLKSFLFFFIFFFFYFVCHFRYFNFYFYFYFRNLNILFHHFNFWFFLMIPTFFLSFPLTLSFVLQIIRIFAYFWVSISYEGLYFLLFCSFLLCSILFCFTILFILLICLLY